MEPINFIDHGHVAGAPFQVGQRVLVLGCTADEPEEIEEDVQRRVGLCGRVTELLYGRAFSGTRYPHDPGIQVAFDDDADEPYTFRPEELIGRAAPAEARP